MKYLLFFLLFLFLLSCEKEYPTYINNNCTINILLKADTLIDNNYSINFFIGNDIIKDTSVYYNRLSKEYFRSFYLNNLNLCDTSLFNLVILNSDSTLFYIEECTLNNKSFNIHINYINSLTNETNRNYRKTI